MTLQRAANRVPIIPSKSLLPSRKGSPKGTQPSGFSPIRPKCPFSSRKASPFLAVFSRSLSPQGFRRPNWTKKARQSMVLNPLTVAFHVTAGPGPASRGLGPPGLPKSLTLALESRIDRSPNPLTSFPAGSHRLPRTPSPACPVEPHQVSRKASPDRAGSLV